MTVISSMAAGVNAPVLFTICPYIIVVTRSNRSEASMVIVLWEAVFLHAAVPSVVLIEPMRFSKSASDGSHASLSAIGVNG